MASSSSFDPDEVYRVLFEQARDGIFVADAQGRYLTVNASGHALLGYAPANDFFRIADRALECRAAR